MHSIPTHLTVLPTGTDALWLAHEPASRHLLAWDGRSLWLFASVDLDMAAEISAAVADEPNLGLTAINEYVGGDRVLERSDFNNWRSALLTARDGLLVDGVRFGTRHASRPIGTLIAMHEEEIAARLDHDADCVAGHGDHAIFLIPMPRGLDHAARLYHFAPARRAIVPPSPVQLLAS